MQTIILGAIFVSVMVSLYIVLLLLNKNTPVPESAKQRHKEARGCTACGSVEKFSVPKEVIEKFKEEHN